MKKTLEIHIRNQNNNGENNSHRADSSAGGKIVTAKGIPDSGTLGLVEGFCLVASVEDESGVGGFRSPGRCRYV